MPSEKRDKQQICLECQRLQAENEALKQQIGRLNKIISELSKDNQQNLEPITSSNIKSRAESPLIDAVSLSYSEQLIDSDTTVLSLRESPQEIITKESTLTQKIALFKALFRGREDVYARRFENQKTGKSGYAPACQNEWKPGVCPKPKIKCQDCSHKSFLSVDEDVIEAHLRGKHVIGIYPLLQDNHCWFLAIDFDEANWKDDVRALRQFCDENDIPVSIERSRSGNGGHAWYFFTEPILSAKARKFGSVLITAIMQRRHEVSFKSYDRLFPAQDTLAKDGLGNLIALPLQGQVAQTGNSCFIDSDFNRYPDQWLFLSQVHRLSEIEIDQYIASLSEGTELGVLFNDGNETESKPWLRKIEDSLDASDFPAALTITLADGIYIQKHGISQRALNRIKRLAVFSNPDFYRKQAMHFSTWDIPRIIACHQEHEQFIQLPRGCQDTLEQLLSDAHVSWKIQDERQPGHSISVSFKGSLWPLQQEAADILVKRDTGVLCGTTAFGKTITAIYLIAYHKVNTLILVDRVPLIQQWQSSIMQFLDIQEQIPETGKSRGRKKASYIVGQMGGSRKDLHKVVDIAVFQSLVSGHEFKDLIKNYGLIIVDECHHVAAASFEKIMNVVNSKYVYGLSATPVRQDGKQPIVYMQCGPIVYRDDARKQAYERPFAHILSPRFTNYQIPSDWDPSQCQMQDIFSDLTLSISRNNQITKDISEALRNGRNVIVLTDRKDHVERLANKIQSAYPNVIALIGVGTAKQKREKLDMIKKQSASVPLIIIATGKYVGEGFDEPRLDTLFLVMPFSWKGTLAQYAGRLHRIYTGKNDVQIYDYVDIHVPVLERMYGKRLKGYRDLGYQVGETGLAPARQNFIYDCSNYWDSLMDDLLAAKEMVWISSTSLNIRTIRSLEKLLEKRKNKLNSQVLFVNNNSQSNKVEKYDYYQKSAEILDRLAFCIRKIDDMLDVIGYNYATSRYENEPKNSANRIVVGTETFPAALDKNWELVTRHGYILGDFSWTSWDYLGEVGIGHAGYDDDRNLVFYGAYPWITAYCADFDLTGYRRPISYWREIVWGGRNHVPYIAVQRPERHGQKTYLSSWGWTDSVSSWTWPGYEGKRIVVEVYSDAEEIELLINGQSRGKQPVGDEFKRFYCKFDTVYAAGRVEAVAYTGGVEVGRYSLKTAGMPKLRVSRERTSLRAGTNDLAYVNIELVDEAGNLNTAVKTSVTVSLEGTGILQASGSGNPRMEEYYYENTHETFYGRMLAIIRAGNEQGKAILTVSAEGLHSETVEVDIV